MSDNKNWSAGPYRIVYKNYPTYSWGLYPQQWVYQNKDMMAAIESSLESMNSYPDAEKIIENIRRKNS